MIGLELVVVLGVAVLLGNALGDRFRIAPPIVLLAFGALLGFVPALREVDLPPEAVLLIFLPVLLYWESLTTSLREIRRDLRGIILMSTVLVIGTAGAVAAVAHELGLAWGPAWVLGAAVAPTDATAVGVLAKSLPRRNVTLLRAESLINDGTALVVFGLAVGITVGEEHFTVPHVTGLFALSYVGGAAAGALTAWLVIKARRVFDDPLLGNVAMILTPFTAYLLAELIEASGVLAAVVAGLIMSQAGPRVAGAAMRRQAEESWSLATFLLNGSLFVLVGLQAQSAVRSLHGSDLTQALIAVGVVSAVVVARALRLQLHLPVPDPPPRPSPAAAPAPHELSRPGGHVDRGLPWCGVAGGGPVGTDDARLGRPLPRPGHDRLRHLRCHRDHAGRAGSAAADRGALGPAAPRHIGGGGAFPRRVDRHRGGPQGPSGSRRRAGHRPCRRRTHAPGVRDPPARRPRGRRTRPMPPTRRTSCATTGTTPRCVWPSWPTNAPPCSDCVTSTRSTTPCCVRSNVTSTSKKYGCPDAKPPSDRPRTGATMHTSPDESTREEVVSAYRAQLRAMTDGDTDALDALLDDGFTLTHITGYEQPKAEWLSQMRAGRFVYHGVAEKTVTVDVEGDTAHLVGRIVTDATVYGTHADWRLQLALTYTREGDTWTAVRSVATTW